MRSPSQRWRLSIDELTPPRRRRVRDQRRRRLDRASASATSKRSARRSPDSGRSAPPDGRAAGAAMLGRRLGLALHAQLERLEPPQQRGRRVGRRGDARPSAAAREGARCAAPAGHGRAEQRVVVAGQELRRRVHDDVGALVERVQEDRRRRRSRRRRRGPGARARASQSGSVSSGFAGASTQTMSASGGAPRLVELDDVDAPGLRAAPGSPRCRSRRLRRARSSCPAGRRRGRRRRGARAGRVEERVAALEPTERLLGGGAGRVRVALVEELARLAAPS